MKRITKQSISFEAMEQEVTVMMLGTRMVPKGRFISLKTYLGNKVSFKSEVQSLKEMHRIVKVKCVHLGKFNECP